MSSNPLTLTKTWKFTYKLGAPLEDKEEKIRKGIVEKYISYYLKGIENAVNIKDKKFVAKYTAKCQWPKTAVPPTYILVCDISVKRRHVGKANGGGGNPVVPPLPLPKPPM